MAKAAQPGRADTPAREKNDIPPHAPERGKLDGERRAALAALGYEEALDALEAEDPVALAVTAEYIALYSQKAGELLKEGKDYFSLLTGAGAVPALERIAMEMVLEAFEDELSENDPSGL